MNERDEKIHLIGSEGRDVPVVNNDHSDSSYRVSYFTSYVSYHENVIEDYSHTGSSRAYGSLHSLNDDSAPPLYPQPELNNNTENTDTVKRIKGIGEEEPNTNFFWTTFNLWNDVLAAGCVAVPSYLNDVGVWNFPFIIIIFGIITAYTLNTLFYLGKKYRKPSLPALCAFGLGKGGYVVACFFMFVFNFGGFCAAMLILGTNIPSLIQAFTGYAGIWASRHYVLCYCSIIFLPLSFAENISKFSFNSFLSIFSIVLMGFMLCFHATVERGKYWPIPAEALHNDLHIYDFLSALGGLSYCFVCHDLSFNVFMSFKEATRKRWRGVAGLTMGLTIVVFLIVGYSGYFMFYHNVNANILDNFPYNDIYANIARIFLSLNILVSVPYSCFMPRVSIYSIFVLIFGELKSNRSRKAFNIIVTLLVSGSSLAIAESVTNLGIIYGLVGAISAVGIAYILPPLIFLRKEKGSWYGPKKLANVGVLIFGVSSMFLATGSILMNLWLKS